MTGSATLFVLTGAPGSGKSAILGALSSEMPCVAEPAREVLADERSRGGTGTPERDADLFVRRLLERSIDKHATALASGRRTLFDRGVPDCIAYAELLAVDPAPSTAAAATYRYYPTVLILEPWAEIYATDDERTMSFDETLPFHDAIVRAYERAGYALRTVPHADVGARAEFVRAFIASNV